jgi:uncharacterized protein
MITIQRQKREMFHILLLVLVFNTFSLPVAVKAAMRCDGKLSPSEAIICVDPELKRLDEILNSTFQYTLNVVYNKSGLKDEQRKWLATLRDGCKDKECFIRVYIARINELGYMQIETLRVIEKQLSNQEAKDVCLSLADLADNNRLSLLSVPGKNQFSLNENDVKAGWGVNDKEKALLLKGYLNSNGPEVIYKLKLKPSGEPVRFAKFFTGGTCSSDQVFNLSYILNAKYGDYGTYGIDDVSDTDDEIRWAYWGGGDYPIIYRGRYFIVTAHLANLDRVNMISWIKPNGKIRPLCLLKVESTQKNVISAKNMSLCSGIANGSIGPITWKPITEELPFHHDPTVYKKEFVKRYGNYADEVSLLNIDINGDGITENIGKFRYDSGAGCGSTRIWLAVLTKDLGGVVKNSLNEILGRFRGSMNIYRYKGKYYIDAVENGTNEGVVQLNGEKIKHVCEFGIKTETDMSRFFDVE